MKPVYIIVHSCANADRGEFPPASAKGGFFSRKRAEKHLRKLVEQEKEELTIPFNEEDYREDYGRDFWEAYQEGYAAAWFTRYEIFEVECEED